MLAMCAGLTLALIMFSVDAYFAGVRKDNIRKKKYHRIKREVARRLQQQEREQERDKED